jgi:hypothetical protein
MKVTGTTLPVPKESQWAVVALLMLIVANDA